MVTVVNEDREYREYGAELPDEMLLGHLAWYGISEVEITLADFTSLVLDSGLDMRIVPKAPRKADAYKRACRYSEMKNVPVPSNALLTANFMIRNVSQDSSMIERHLVLEIVDSDAKQLVYEPCAHLVWDRNEEKLIVRRKGLGVDYDGLIDAALDRFTSEFKKALNNLDMQVLRQKVRQRLETMNALIVKERSSIYFVPLSAKKDLRGLETLLGSLGGNSHMHSIPIIDDLKQREMIQNAFEQDIHREAVQKISELDEHIRTGRKLTPGQWAHYRDTMNRLNDSRSNYQKLLGSEIETADIEINAMQKKLTQMIEKDLVA